MSFIRPEIHAQIVRFREVLIGGAVFLLGLWWLLGPGGLLIIPGSVALVAGGALTWIGSQRARFRGAGDGLGTVQVDEGQIAYFGPLTGGIVALRELERLSLDGRQHPMHWRFEQRGQDDVLIPVNAAGSDALFDAFAILPGLNTEAMLSELSAKSGHLVVIWQKPGAVTPLH